MKVKKNKKTEKLVCSLLASLMMLCTLFACGGDDPDPTPTSPTLSLNPADLTFMSTKGNSQSFQIKTNASWRVVYTPDWLSASSSQGTGETTLTLTTTKDNNTSQKLSDQVEIVATSDGGGTTSQKIAVYQNPGVETDCYARVSDNNMLIMSYGMACVIDYGNNTKNFYYKIYTDAQFSSLKGDDAKIASESRNWNQMVIPSSGGVELTDANCQPNTRYVLVTVSYASNGSRGDICIKEFMTKGIDEQPLASITPEKNVVTEVQNGNNGTYYKWDVKRANGTCEGYITYVCAGPSKFATMNNRYAALGATDYRDGINLAWNIWLERKSGEETHETSFNKATSGCHEKLFTVYKNDATNSFEYRSTDRYLQIVTWGVGSNNEPSGVVSDVVYTIENGQLKEIDTPSPSWTFSLSTTSLIFESTNSSQSVRITTNDDWKVSSNQSWCSISPMSGSNSGEFKVTVSSNSQSSAREAIITATGTNSGKSVTLNVTQKAHQEEIVSNCTTKPDVVALFTDGMVTSFTAESNVSTCYAQVLTQSEYNSYSDDAALAAYLVSNGSENPVSELSDYIYGFFTNSKKTYSPNTTYYLCTVSHNSAGKRGDVVRYSYKTNATNLPIAEISGIKATTVDGNTWSWTMTLKNNATSYYLYMTEDDDDYEDDDHWLGWNMYKWIKNGSLTKTYDFTDPYISRSGSKATIRSWAQNSRNELGNFTCGRSSSSVRTRSAWTPAGQGMKAPKRSISKAKAFKISQ